MTRYPLNFRRAVVRDSANPCVFAVLKLVVVFWVGMGSITSCAQAQQSTSPKLEITARPYLWIGAGKATADLSTFDPSAAELTEFSLSTANLVKGIRLGGMSAIEARRNGYVVILDAAYGNFALSGSSINPSFDGTTLDINAWMFHILAGRDIIRREHFQLNVVGGVRIFDTSFTLNLPAAPPNPPIEIPVVKDTFVDPVIGSTGSIAISDRISANLYGDVGGFGASSDLTWQIFGSVDYAITNAVSLDIGYRHIKWSIDQDENEILREFQGSGPIIGLQWRF